MDSLPKGWKFDKLGNYVKSVQNGFGRRPKGSEEGPIVLRLADVSSGKIDLSTPRHVTMSDQEFYQYKIDRGDILFIRVNGSRDLVARSLVIDREYENVAFNDHLIRIKLKEDLDGKYLHELTNTDFIRSKLLAFIPPTVGGQLTVNQENLFQLTIPLPPLPEQQKIAEILSTWDEDIQKTERLVAALQTRKKGLMQRLLTGQVRLPGFEGEWRKLKLKEICIISAGNSFAEKFQGNLTGEFPFYKVSDMNLEGNNKYLNDANNYVSKSLISEQKWKLFIAGTIVFPKVGATIHTNKKRLLSRKSLVDNNVMTVNVMRKDQCDPEYLYYWFLRLNLSKYSNPGALPSLKSEDINNIEITIPEINEQQKISALFLLCDSEIRLQELNFNNIRKQKKGLMQRLLTGQVRVKL